MLCVSARTSSSGPEKESELKSRYEQLLSGMQKNLESQKEQTARAQLDLSVQKEQVYYIFKKCNYHLLSFAECLLKKWLVLMLTFCMVLLFELVKNLILSLP